jgi:archaellum component FlaG (FlaF/FlaG flagellin family)
MPAPPVPYLWNVADVANAALLNAQLHDGLTFMEGPPRVQISCNAAQTLTTTTTFVSLSMNTEQVDSENGHSTTVNNSRYTCQVAGWYWVQATCSIGPGAGNRSLQLAVNGATVPGTTIIQVAPSGNSWGGQTSGWLPLNVGDYLELQAWQNSGASLNTNVGTGLQPTLSAYWISN